MELAAWLSEFFEQIKKIQVRLWDLLPVIRNHVYHPAFGGSYSLKWVLPALVTEMTYDGMAVANGEMPGSLGNHCFGELRMYQSETR